MKYFLSAFRNPSDPDGAEFVEKIPFDKIEDALDWIYANIFRARNPQAKIRFDVVADRNGFTELVANYEGEWSQQNFDQLNGVETIIIQRADVAEDP